MGGWQQCQQQHCGFLEDPTQGGRRGRTQSPSPSLGQRALGTPTRTPTSHPGHPTWLPTPARTFVLAVLRSFPAAAARAVPSLALPARGSESSTARPAAPAPHTPQTSPRASAGGAGGQAGQGGDLGLGRACSHLPQCWHGVLALPVPPSRPDALLPQPHWGCSGHCGHHLPQGSVPGRAPGRVSPPPGRAGGHSWISLLGACSTPGLGCEGRTDSAACRRLTGPPGSPGSAGGIDGCGEAGMAEPLAALPAVAVGKG